MMTSFTDEISNVSGIPTQIVWVLGIVLCAIVAGSVIRIGSMLFTRPIDTKNKERLGSLGVWWGLFFLLTTVVALGPYAVVILFAIISMAGLREYRQLVSRRQGISPTSWVFVVAIIHYGIVAAAKLGPFWTLIPVWVLAALLVQLVIGEETKNFLEIAGTVYLGLMLLVYMISHAALMVTMPLVPRGQGAGPMGLLVYLVLLTESNDIAQALWGRRFGRHKITPRVSPGKTWEGFLLGAATTLTLAILLAKPLTPLATAPIHVEGFSVAIPYLPAVIAGLLIAVAGFFGDVTFSAIKREVGVKDSGSLLPGQGGILDRIDSLTFTAPAFFYFVYIFCR
jgi:phosphatidate cytidylyltransferase